MQLVHTTPGAQPRDRLIRLPEVERASGLKKSTIYGLMRKGEFPRCIHVTRRLAAWPESAVLAWVNARIREGSESC
jgi:prophage regulatory protein